MKKSAKHKWITLVLLVVAVIATVEFKKFMQRRAPACVNGSCAVPSEYAVAKATGPQTVPLLPPKQTNDMPLPRLIDFGAGQCATCKMMEVVLDEIAQEYDGRLRIQFVDAREQQEIAERHGIRMIPTQVFFDARGNELFRHEGFISKEDILKKWAELGVTL